MPNFSCKTNEGPMQFHEWLEGSWAILFSHPADYTPVCTTELSTAQKMYPEFEKRGVKMVALSCDSAESHIGWICDIKQYTGDTFSFPIISDFDRNIAVQLGMIDPDEKDAQGMALTARAVFIIGPDKKLKASILYPATTGRCFDEILRAVDSLQLTTKYKVATPSGWRPGDEVMVQPSVPDADLAKLFPGGVRREELPSQWEQTDVKLYMRYTRIDEPVSQTVLHKEPPPRKQ